MRWSGQLTINLGAGDDPVLSPGETDRFMDAFAAAIRGSAGVLRAERLPQSRFYREFSPCTYAVAVDFDADTDDRLAAERFVTDAPFTAALRAGMGTLADRRRQLGWSSMFEFADDSEQEDDEWD